MDPNPRLAEELLSRLHVLPARIQTHHKLLNALADPNTPTRDIVEGINKDVALTANLLKIANSVLFATAGSTFEAVTRVGTTRLQTLVATAWAFRLMDESQHVLGFEPEAEWEHALHVAALCEAMVEETEFDPGLKNEVFSAAMLHDLGKILIAVNAPEVYATISEEASERSLSRWKVEQELLTFDHAFVAAEMLAGWSMPRTAIDAIRWHHQPELHNVDTLSSLVFVHIANCKARETIPDANCMGKYCVQKMKRLQAA
jgi:putative nucleotidyltransferase with HDIG domain